MSPAGVLGDDEIRNLIAIDVLAAARINRRGHAAAGINRQHLAFVRVNDGNAFAVSRRRYFRVRSIHPPLDLKRANRLLVMENRARTRCNLRSLSVQRRHTTNSAENEDGSMQNPLVKTEPRRR